MWQLSVIGVLYLSDSFSMELWGLLHVCEAMSYCLDSWLEIWYCSRESAADVWGDFLQIRQAHRWVRVEAPSSCDSEHLPGEHGSEAWEASWLSERWVRNSSVMLRLSCVLISFNERGTEVLRFGSPMLDWCVGFPKRQKKVLSLQELSAQVAILVYRPNHAPRINIFYLQKKCISFVKQWTYPSNPFFSQT